MLARLLLSKVLNFLKSSRLVFATIFMFAHSSCVVANEPSIPSSVRTHFGNKGTPPARIRGAKPMPMPSTNVPLRKPAIHRSKTHPL